MEKMLGTKGRVLPRLRLNIGRVRATETSRARMAGVRSGITSWKPDQNKQEDWPSPSPRLCPVFN